MRLDLIQRQLLTLGLTQKDVAARVFDRLENESQRAFSTLESKLSKLLSGSNEGRKAFTQSALQAALAASLDVPENQFAEWLAGEAILLDPALSADLIDTARRQAANINVEFVEVPGEPGKTPRDALRAAADTREDAIVALATEDDAAFYEGRGRRFSTMKHRYPFGATLSRYPDLLPALPPQPPVAWDERTRERPIPHVVHPALEAAIERGDVELADGRVFAALQTELAEHRSHNRIPSFSLSAVQPWIEHRSGATFSLLSNKWDREPRYGVQPVDADPAADNTTVVWIHERRIHVRGRDSERLVPWLSPHDVVIADPAVDAFRAALSTRNPFSDPLFAKLVAEARAVGLDLTPWLKKHLDAISAEPADAAVLGLSDEQESSARSLLLQVCTRAWHIPGALDRSTWSSNRASPSSVPFWLRRAVRAPLLVLEPDAFCQLRIIASMGAGRVLHVRLSRFSGSAPTPLRLTPTKQGWSLEVDGGDVHLWLRTEYDEMLEADSLVPRRRRDEAAEARNDDADDD